MDLGPCLHYNLVSEFVKTNEKALSEKTEVSSLRACGDKYYLPPFCFLPLPFALVGVLARAS